MRMTGNPGMVLALILPLAVAGCGHSPGAENTKADAQAAAEKRTDTAKDVLAQGKVAVQEGVQKAGEVATNVAAKAEVIATNVASHVKSATTNIVSQVKEKFEKLTH